MTTTEINQKLRDLDSLLGSILKKMHTIKDARDVRNLSKQLQNVSQHPNK